MALTSIGGEVSALPLNNNFSYLQTLISASFTNTIIYGNTTEAIIVNDNAYVGIGTSPSAVFTISSENMGGSEGDASMLLVGNSNKERLNVRSAITGGGTAVVGVFCGRGNVASPGATQSGDNIGYFQLGGYDGSQYIRSAWLTGSATENWSGSARGSQLQLVTTTNGGTAMVVGVEISNTGAVKHPSISTTASAANAFLDSSDSNNLLRSTSSIRYKDNIQDITDDESSIIYSLRPISYKSKAASDDKTKRWYGLIAEEVAEVEPKLVHYREESEEILDASGVKTHTKTGNVLPDGVQYERICVLLLAEIKKMRTEIDLLKSRAELPL